MLRTYALYALVDELEASDLGTYLAAVMAEMSRLAAHPDIRVQEYCVQVLGVMAINTGSAFAPYFENVCRGFIPMMNFTEPERVKLRGWCARRLCPIAFVVASVSFTFCGVALAVAAPRKH